MLQNVVNNIILGPLADPSRLHAGYWIRSAIYSIACTLDAMSAGPLRATGCEARFSITYHVSGCPVLVGFRLSALLLGDSTLWAIGYRLCC